MVTQTELDTIRDAFKFVSQPAQWRNVWMADYHWIERICNVFGIPENKLSTKWLARALRYAANRLASVVSNDTGIYCDQYCPPSTIIHGKMNNRKLNYYFVTEAGSDPPAPVVLKLIRKTLSIQSKHNCRIWYGLLPHPISNQRHCSIIPALYCTRTCCWYSYRRVRVRYGMSTVGFSAWNRNIGVQM